MDDDQKVRDVISKLDGCREEIEKFSADFDMNYEQMMQAADDWLAHGEYAHLNFDTPTYDFDHFWELYEKVRGVKDPDNNCFFSCSC